MAISILGSRLAISIHLNASTQSACALLLSKRWTARNPVCFSNAAGVLHVAAAGNSGNSKGTGDNVIYPAKYDSVIAVAATDRASLHVAGVAALVFGCGLTTRTTDTYKVFAVNGSSVSAASNTLSVKTK